MFIIVTNDATTAMVTTFLLSPFDNVWAFGMFELVFRGMVEDWFFLSVVVVEFCVIGLFERVFLVDADGWSLFPSPFFDLVVAFVVTGVFVVVENRCAEVLGIGSWMKRIVNILLSFTSFKLLLLTFVTSKQRITWTRGGVSGKGGPCLLTSCYLSIVLPGDIISAMWTSYVNLNYVGRPIES